MKPMTTEMISPFPTTTVKAGSGTLTLPSEPVNEYIAITPCTHWDSEGRPRLGAGFALTHVPSGYRLGQFQACIECCREAGRRLLAVDLDWSKVGASDGVRSLPEKTRLAVIEALRPSQECHAELCDPKEAASW